MDSFQAHGEAVGSAEGPSAGAGEESTRSGIMGEAMARVGGAAGEVLQQAKAKGTTLAGTAGDTAKDILAQRVSSGGEWIGHVGRSTKTAADHFEQQSPELAEMIRQAGRMIEKFASELQNRPIDDLLQTATDFARRRPEVVFGVSALVGFLAFRALSNTAASASRDSRPQG
jgi:hypothetical protein